MMVKYDKNCRGHDSSPGSNPEERMPGEEVILAVEHFIRCRLFRRRGKPRR